MIGDVKGDKRCSDYSSHHHNNQGFASLEPPRNGKGLEHRENGLWSLLASMGG